MGLVLCFLTGLDALGGSKIYLTALGSRHHTAVDTMLLVSGVQVSPGLVNNVEQVAITVFLYFSSLSPGQLY